MDRSPEMTRSQVNKAGKIIRSWWGTATLMSPDVEDALTTLWRWRASHQYPLTKANNGLRSMVRSEGCRVEVSQRLKRIPTIVDKLARQPTMQLATMQDIGGCRAVLDSIDEIRRIERRLHRTRRVRRTSDYISSPRSSGYRGVHVIVEYDSRAIEVQLRTRVMHEWAIAVERFSGRLGEDLKSGRGPAPMLEWLSAVSEAMATEESGAVVAQEMLSRIDRLREGAQRALHER